MLDTVGPGHILLADRAYDSDALRRSLEARGARANVKPMPRRVNIPSFSPFLYRYRNLVERFFNKLKHYRAIATRYEKHAVNYLALVKLETPAVVARSAATMQSDWGVERPKAAGLSWRRGRSSFARSDRRLFDCRRSIRRSGPASTEPGP